MLTRGAADSKDPFHWPVLASVDEEGHADARTVVLRRWYPEKNTLEVHSAGDTAKVSQLRKNASATLVFYHERSRIQIRAKTIAIIHQQNRVTEDAWERLSENTRKGYPGYQDFCVISLELIDLDWLCLIPADQHQRAGFIWQASNQLWKMEWRTP
jgi:general stress protein 26